MITWDQFVERLQARWADSPTPEVMIFEIAVLIARPAGLHGKPIE